MEKVSKEDYLRTIYSLYEELDDKKSGVRSIDVSKQLKVSKATVSEMMKKLASKGYVNAKPYSNIILTNKGLKEAKRVMHNHRVIEVFLKKILKYEIEKNHFEGEIHREAHMLEHAFSDESIKRLDNFLNKPKICPDGKEIPNR